MIETDEIKEKVILIGVSSQEGDDTEESLEELADLVKTANAQPIATVIQNRESIHPGNLYRKR